MFRPQSSEIRPFFFTIQLNSPYRCWTSVTSRKESRISLFGAKLYDGYMIAPGSSEWGRPSAWPNSWTATAKRLKPGAGTSQHKGHKVILNSYINVSESKTSNQSLSQPNVLCVRVTTLVLYP